MLNGRGHFCKVIFSKIASMIISVLSIFRTSKWKHIWTIITRVTVIIKREFVNLLNAGEEVLVARDEENEIYNGYGPG